MDGRKMKDRGTTERSTTLYFLKIHLFYRDSTSQGRDRPRGEKSPTENLRSVQRPISQPSQNLGIVTLEKPRGDCLMNHAKEIPQNETSLFKKTSKIDMF